MSTPRQWKWWEWPLMAVNPLFAAFNLALYVWLGTIVNLAVAPFAVAASVYLFWQVPRTAKLRYENDHWDEMVRSRYQELRRS